jgi:pimeloyl-ACP methyl ester carboxylesterase
MIRIAVSATGPNSRTETNRYGATGLAAEFTARRMQALSLLILLQTIATAAPPPGIRDGWSDGYVYANGARLHYYHAVPAPGKPVMVMIHGVTDNGLCWTTLTWKLQDDYDVYMVDTRSHGLSDPITTADDADTLIKDVVEFVKAMGFEKPILMGHSMGGATVIRVGAEYPDPAKAIVVLDAGIGGPGGGRGRGGPGPGARGPQGQGSETNAAARGPGLGAPPQNAQRSVSRSDAGQHEDWRLAREDSRAHDHPESRRLARAAQSSS